MLKSISLALVINIGLFTHHIYAATHAVILGGSSGIQNYHYQSSACHFQKLLLSSGIEKNHITTFIRDDIANHDDNLFKSQLFNYMSEEKAGFDVRKDCIVDYKGNEADKAIFQAVINGESENVYKKGTGKIMFSGPGDNLILYLTGNGAQGIFEMPSGEPLYADELTKYLRELQQMRRYKQMIIFHDSSYSGSFYDNLDPALNVLAITSADRNSTSWAAFCPPGNDTIAGKHLGLCLGDLFTVSLIKSIAENEQNIVINFKELINNLNNVNDQLKVKSYGDLSILSDNLASYFGSAEACQQVDRVVSAQHPDNLFLDNYYHIKQTANYSIMQQYTRLNRLVFLESHNKTQINSRELLAEIKYTEVNKLIFDAIKADLRVGGLRIDENTENKDTDVVYSCYRQLVNLYNKRCQQISTITYYFLGHFYDICSHTVIGSDDVYDALSLKLNNLCSQLESTN